MLRLKHYSPHKESGAVLIVALIFLIVLTLLGVSAMDNTVLETKMAANNRERAWAFQVAEMGLTISNSLLQGNEYSDAEQSNLETLTRTGVYDFDDSFEIDIERDGDKGNVQSIDTKVWFKGFFASPVSNAASASSATKLQVVYFETATKGQSGNTSVSLRNGVRQGVPKQQ